MRNLFTIGLFLLSFCLEMDGQFYPSRWTQFCSERYIYAIEKDECFSNSMQAAFIDDLLDRARLNVARQVSISVADKAQLVKEAINGVTNIAYSSNTKYSTEVTMKLLHTDTEYYASSRKGLAIAYIDKIEAYEYWTKEADRIITDLETDYCKADRMIALGYKERAKGVLEALSSKYGAMNDPLLWLSLFSNTSSQYKEVLDRFTVCVRRIDNAILSLGHGIAIFLDYHSDLFGEEYPAALSQLSASLASSERCFVDNPLDADWIVKIDARASEGPKTTLGSKNVYFTHVEVFLTITKTRTFQTVYKETISVKEGDTRDYKHAGVTAFKSIASRLYKPINNHICE